jgi:hypothetical protein
MLYQAMADIIENDRAAPVMATYAEGSNYGVKGGD